LKVSRTKTPWRAADLERDKPTLEFFDTLESGHNVGLVHRCGKAHERRPLIVEAKTRGEKSSKGHKG
jgi:hypothetical protein